MKKALVYLIVIICSIGTANAQWHFYLTSVNYNSNCNNLTNHLEVLVLEQIANSTANETYSSLDECEAMRNMATIRYSKNGCSIRTTTSPCVGGVISGGASGAADILGPSQGRSFYTTNPANEIKNWSSDDIERHLALDQKFQTTRPEAIVTTDAKYNEERATARENSTWYVDPDKPFVPVNLRDGGSSTVRLDGFSMRDKIDNAQEIKSPANQANVQQYVNATNISAVYYLNTLPDLTQVLHERFKFASGFDLDAIMQKLPSERTEAEKQALIDYQEFRKEVTDKLINDINKLIANKEEVKDFEMAVLAENCYKDSEHAFLSRTNYKEVSTGFFPEDSPLKKLSEIIDDCNSTNSTTGFHAEIYYNEITHEYTIAFEGTNTDEFVNDILKTDAVEGFGGVPSQYELAYRITEYINSSSFPSDIKINFTGHSLGGGLASVAGLATGKPTYTYNAAGVNKNIIEQFELTGKSEDNIKAFQTAGGINSDPLTSVQEGELKVPTTSAVIGIVSVVSPIAGGKLAADVVTGRAAAPAVGKKEKVWSNSGHSIIPMVSYFARPVARYESIKHEVYVKGHGVEEQTQDRILIKLGN